jgi:hypothetical protein
LEHQPTPTPEIPVPHVLDINQAVKETLLTKKSKFVTFFIGGTVLWWLILFTLVAPHIPEKTVGHLALIPLIVGIMIVASIRAVVRQAFWKTVATQYGWNYHFHKDITKEKAVLFSMGNDRMAGHSIAGTYAEHPFAIFEYQFETGVGKSKATHSFTVFETKFSGTFPHLYLNYKNDHSGFKLPSKLARVSLPSEFEKQFTLYSPLEYEIETLEILTPDILQHLLESGWNHDMEFVEGELVIYRAGKLNDFASLTAEVDKIKNFIDILSPRLNRMKLAQIGDLTSLLS